MLVKGVPGVSTSRPVHVSIDFQVHVLAYHMNINDEGLSSTFLLTSSARYFTPSYPNNPVKFIVLWIVTLLTWTAKLLQRCHMSIIKLQIFIQQIDQANKNRLLTHRDGYSIGDRQIPFTKGQ